MRDHPAAMRDAHRDSSTTLAEIAHLRPCTGTDIVRRLHATWLPAIALPLMLAMPLSAAAIALLPSTARIGAVVLLLGGALVTTWFRLRPLRAALLQCRECVTAATTMQGSEESIRYVIGRCGRPRLI